MAGVREVQALASLALKRRNVRRRASDVRAASQVALQSGGQIAPHPFIPDAPQVVSWDLAGDCLSPWVMAQVGEGHFYGEKDEKGNVVSRSFWRSDDGASDTWEPGRTLEQKVRCRVCANCLRARGRLWFRRAVVETKLWPRSWFVTLTFRPEERVKLLYETIARVGGQGPWSRLSAVDRFRELLRTIGPLVTRWLKRLRGPGRAKLRFRYLLVVEKHEDGWPHFHALLHEVSELMPLRKAVIQRQWPHGFSQVRLVDDARGGARYVAKYLSKDAASRVRASKDYGGELCEPEPAALRF